MFLINKLSFASHLTRKSQSAYTCSAILCPFNGTEIGLAFHTSLSPSHTFPMLRFVLISQSEGKLFSLPVAREKFNLENAGTLLRGSLQRIQWLGQRRIVLLHFYIDTCSRREKMDTQRNQRSRDLSRETCQSAARNF